MLVFLVLLFWGGRNRCLSLRYLFYLAGLWDSWASRSFLLTLSLLLVNFFFSFVHLLFRTILYLLYPVCFSLLLLHIFSNLHVLSAFVCSFFLSSGSSQGSNMSCRVGFGVSGVAGWSLVSMMVVFGCFPSFSLF